MMALLFQMRMRRRRRRSDTTEMLSFFYDPKRRLKACIDDLQFTEFKLERELKQKRLRYAKTTANISKLVASGNVSQARTQAQLSVMTDYDIQTTLNMLGQINVIRTAAERAMNDIDMKKATSTVTAAMSTINREQANMVLEDFAKFNQQMTERSSKITDMSQTVHVSGSLMNPESQLSKDADELLNRITAEYALHQAQTLGSAPQKTAVTEAVAIASHGPPRASPPPSETKENDLPTPNEASFSLSDFERRLEELSRG